MWWKALVSVVFFAGFVFVAVTFSNDPTVEDFAYAPSLDGPAAGVIASNTDLPVADQIFVCRAALAEVTGQSIDIIAAKAVSGVLHAEYTKPEDGTVWRTACRIDGDRIIWAYLFDDGSQGRWRTDVEDELITFALSDAAVTITRSLGDQPAVVGQVSRGSD